MNKMVKGSVAGAAGIALLMGGFGTYALWSETVEADGGAITSGALRIDSVADGTWTYGSPTGDGWDNYGDDRDLLVPGDTVFLSQPLAVTAVGSHLKADLIISGVDNDFAADSLTMTVTFGGKTETFTKDDEDSSGNYVIHFDSAADIQNLNRHDEGAVLSFTFEDVDGLTDQDTSIDLSNVAVTLQQVDH